MSSLKTFFAGAALALTIGGVGTAGAATFSVPGTSDPFLSGMPAGSLCCFGDSATAESPVYAGSVTAGTTLTFTNVTGSVSYAGGTPSDVPDGNNGLLVSTPVYEGGLTTINNIAGYYNAPVDALIGVFLGTGLPTGNPAPALLDFNPFAGGTSFSTLSPALQQIFFIGDGLTGTGTGSVQTFVVPAGAARLYLATVDGEGWYNNTGTIDVTINTASAVPEPMTIGLLAVGLAGIGLVRRRKLSVARQT